MIQDSKPVAIVNGRAGASLPFVLAIMMLLMAVSVSALAAASVASGAGAEQKLESRLESYADGVQQSLLYSLQNGELNCNVDYAKTLGGQLMNVLYDKANDVIPQSSYQIQVDEVKMTGGTLGDACSISIDIQPNVTIRKSYKVSYPNFDADGNEVGSTEVRYPQEANLAAKVTLIVKNSDGGKDLISASSYEYSGGFLQDDGDENKMIIKNAGEWRFLSYDKVDRRPT